VDAQVVKEFVPCIEQLHAAFGCAVHYLLGLARVNTEKLINVEN